MNPYLVVIQMLNALIITTLTGRIHNELVETLNIANQPRSQKDIALSYQLVKSLSSSTFFNSSDFSMLSKLAICVYNRYK